MKHISHAKKISLIGSIIVGCAVSYYVSYGRATIDEFNFENDKQFIAACFKEDWYWLTTKPQTIGVDKTLEQFKHHAISLYNPATYNKLIIKVMHVNSYAVGFVAYFMKSFYEGTILFLDVCPMYRGKHYGEKLLDHACTDLYSKGATIVRLITRPSNASAIKLYMRTGFKEYKRDDIFAYFEKNKQN